VLQATNQMTAGAWTYVRVKGWRLPGGVTSGGKKRGPSSQKKKEPKKTVGRKTDALKATPRTVRRSTTKGRGRLDRGRGENSGVRKTRAEKAAEKNNKKEKKCG